MQLEQAYTSYGARWRPSGSFEFVLAAEMTLAIMGEGGRAIGVVVVVGGRLVERCDAKRCDAIGEGGLWMGGRELWIRKGLALSNI